MELNVIKEKIRHYLDSSRQTPLVVDVADVSEMMSLEMEFSTGSNVFVDAYIYCAQDSLPQMDKLQDDLTYRTNNVFLTGLSTFLLLEGEDKLRKAIRSLLDMEVNGKLVILTFQCSPMLQFKDRRLADAGRIILRENISGRLPIVYFVTPKLSDNVEARYVGIQTLSQTVEKDEKDAIYIETDKSKDDFPNSLFSIKQYSSAYDMLIRKYTDLHLFESDLGTEEQWEYLLSVVDKSGNWLKYVDEELGGTAYLGQNIGRMKSMPENQRWTYFLAMKLHGVKSKPYLSQVLALSHSIAELYGRIYSHLLGTDVKSKGFMSQYDERKDLIESLDIPVAIVSDFCKQAESKGKDGIWYLTDCTQQEKELAITLIAENAESYNRKSLETTLKVVFPQLASYLAIYDYGNTLLNSYFCEYSYNKVTNQILPEFRQMVEEQAVKRDYNLILQPRSLVLSKLNLSYSKAYFVDALGIEFLSYIRDLCYERDLDCDISVARCNLPSITSKNKEFVDNFANACVQLVDVKALDDLKHEGTSAYNYEHTKMPIHLIAELSVIDNVLSSIENDLAHEGIEKVMIVSDHGASRLAVINEKENKWEVAEKGLHSGRCCPISDISEKPDYATEEDGFWCLANYDRFKGGRRAQVEVHGGATLEEVAVPIIVIRKAGDKVKCYIIDDYKSVTVSFKKNAYIQIFIGKKVDDAKVVLNGNTYEAKATDKSYIYQVDMPDIKKKGTYTIDVYIGNSKIAQGLIFEAKSAGASENKYF